MNKQNTVMHYGKDITVTLKGEMIYIYRGEQLVKAIESKPTDTFETFKSICERVKEATEKFKQ